ncbi:MAG: alanine--tRNA ligase [Chloroflexi bacterium]|nr:alanine--tRNA ligase [Chloroflexota bacterium]
MEQPTRMRSVDELRQGFLDYFQERGHLVVPSSSLVPAGDPTLLLTTAGMVQFKPYFLDEAAAPRSRMTSAQKCFRTTDIEEVGDHKHLTFFEMLGNFSVGDYFKQGAIEFAWEFVTKHLELPPEKLYLTVYTDDDEAEALWRDTSGTPPERMYRYGASDNWWGPPGAEGPCGPCSELHYDFGEALGCAPLSPPAEVAAWVAAGMKPEDQPGCHPNCDRCERFVEFWNLVFMQFYQDIEGQLSPLPKPNVDTGMGLERIAIIKQGASNIYDTDLYQPIIGKVAELAGARYGASHDTDVPMRVAAEHTRGAVFLISDGVIPGNEGRGYVLRRLVRRAVRFGRKLGLTDPFLTEVSDVVIERMGGAYPDLVQNREFILRVITLEEDRFRETVERGIGVLTGMLTYRNQHKGAIPEIIEFANLRNPGAENAASVLEAYGFVAYDPEAPSEERHGQEIAANAVSELAFETFNSIERGEESETAEWAKLLSHWGDSVSGGEAFYLYDTYGFPVEETVEIAQEHGLTVDIDAFEQHMEAQRERGRAATEARLGGGGEAKIFRYRDLGVGRVTFVGYDRLSQQSEVLALLTPDGDALDSAEAGQDVEVVLRETPFYAEGGGQVGDTGAILSLRGHVDVSDTQSPIDGLIVHKGRVRSGAIASGDEVEARVDRERRMDVARNHSSTHLLHEALRRVLGSHVRQAGSLVAPDRLRFDFTHLQAMTPEEVGEVEALVNEQVRRNAASVRNELTYTSALEHGYLAFFGDKYGETVRVIDMGLDDPDASSAEPFSREVCGGTHLDRPGEVGLFLITSESSIGSGIRRVEAVTGRAAEAMARSSLATLESAAQQLETTPTDIETRIEALKAQLDAERRRAESLERANARAEAGGLVSEAQDVGGVNVVSARVTAPSADVLREMAGHLRDRLGSGVVMLGAVANEKPMLISMVTPDLVERGLNAASLVREAAAVVGGGGGGKPDMAQAGGSRPDKLDEALALAPQLVGKAIGQGG